MRKATEEQLLARIEILTGELDECRHELHLLRNDAQSRVETEYVHRMLDAAGVPREEAGRRLFLRARIEWLAERSKNG